MVQIRGHPLFLMCGFIGFLRRLFRQKERSGNTARAVSGSLGRQDPDVSSFHLLRCPENSLDMDGLRHSHSRDLNNGPADIFPFEEKSPRDKQTGQMENEQPDGGHICHTPFHESQRITSPWIRVGSIDTRLALLVINGLVLMVTVLAAVTGIHYLVQNLIFSGGPTTGGRS